MNVDSADTASLQVTLEQIYLLLLSLRHCQKARADHDVVSQQLAALDARLAEAGSGFDQLAAGIQARWERDAWAEHGPAFAIILEARRARRGTVIIQEAPGWRQPQRRMRRVAEARYLDLGDTLRVVLQQLD